jgi:hypothetical protein
VVKFITVEVDGVQFQVLERHAAVITQLKQAIFGLASGLITEAAVATVRQDARWMGSFSVLDDGGYDRLADATGQLSTELRRRGVAFQGNAPANNRSAARN